MKLGELARRLFGVRPAPTAPARITGPPASSNGASSFHVWWQMGGAAFREVSAVFECVVPPAVDKRYFWALQASFRDGAERTGGAHFGLQWAPEHPGHGAVNWGGYWSRRYGGRELDGTDSPLPGARPTRNTRDYAWVPNRRYRFRIFPTPGRNGSWRGEITDLETGVATVVRDLHCPGCIDNPFPGYPIYDNSDFVDPGSLLPFSIIPARLLTSPT